MKGRCTGGKGQEDPMAPKAPLPWTGQGGSFSQLKSPKLPPFAISELSPPSSIRAEQRSGVWESGLYLHRGSQLTQLPPVLRFPPRAGKGGGEEGGEDKSRARAPGREKRSARLPRKVPGNSRAITGPGRLPGVDCTAGAESGNAQQALPEGGGGGDGRKLKGICLVIIWHRTLRVFVPFVPLPVWRREKAWDVRLENSAMRLGPGTTTDDRADSLLLGLQKESDPPSQPLVPPAMTASPLVQGKGGETA